MFLEDIFHPMLVIVCESFDGVLQFICFTFNAVKQLIEDVWERLSVWFKIC